MIRSGGTMGGGGEEVQREGKCTWTGMVEG